MAKKSKVVSVCGNDVVFVELEVRQVRELMGIVPTDLLDALALEDISLSELSHMAGIDVSALDGATSADLEALRAAAKEVNPLFFGMRERLIKQVEKAQ